MPSCGVTLHLAQAATLKVGPFHSGCLATWESEKYIYYDSSEDYTHQKVRVKMSIGAELNARNEPGPAHRTTSLRATCQSSNHVTTIP